VGIDLTKFRVRETSKTKRDLNILCVARLVPEKGIEDLVKAFLEIRKNNHSVHLTLIGSGPLKHDYSGYKAISIKQVPYSKMPVEYSKADFFCLPSRTTKTWEEQYGMCLIEAMACGLPIITTRTGAIPEVCGDAALYAKPSNPNNLKTHLEKLIEDKELRLKMGKQSRQRAEAKFDRLQIAKQIGEIYRKLAR